jgi:hypothetical protein
LRLDVHGLRVAATGDWPEVIDQLRLDFAWFEDTGTAGDPAVAITIERGRPDFASFGEVPAAFVTPRNVVYQLDGRTIVDYRGQAVSVLDRATGSLRVRGEDPDLVHEAAYHYVLSRVGEHLDSSGLPRLHALALSGASGAVAVLLPSGGGKSTLALRALRTPGVRLLSEDSPLMDRRGRLHPFPLRIGFNATDEVELPGAKLRTLERMEFHAKVALEVESFRDRVESEPQPLRHLLIGSRTLGNGARLEPLPRRAAAGTLFREAVVGVGLYQGMEFVLQRGMRDVLSQAGPAATRAACCAALVSRARVWRFTIGRDLDRNWETLEPLLR